MKLIYLFNRFVVILLLVSACHCDKHGADVDDNEFAEFEDDFETDNLEVAPDDEVKSSNQKEEEGFEMHNEFDDEEDAMVEVEGEEFDQLDPEEFEGLDDTDDTIWDNEDDDIIKKPNKKNTKKPELKIANVPLNARTWDKYFSEILALSGILVYLLNFLNGKFKNGSLASSWLKTHLSYLQSQFEMVGDDGVQKEAESTLQLNKETEHLYNLWCSGRTSIAGLLVELKFIKRQDLISIISSYIMPTRDQVLVSITLESLDPFVFACGNKKSVAKLQKNMEDMSLYCNDKLKSGEKFGIPESMCVTSEHGEVVSAVLDAKIKQVINQHSDLFDSVHISDQFSGPKPYSQDEQPTNAPETEKKLNFTFNFPSTAASNSAEVEKLLPLLKMAFYIADKLNKFRLSRDAKSKSDKARQNVASVYLKQTHLQRQEAAQLKKEEKNRAMKDRIMNEENPDKQRKLEEQQHRRDLKKKEKKNKNRQMKIKAM